MKGAILEGVAVHLASAQINDAIAAVDNRTLLRETTKDLRHYAS